MAEVQSPLIKLAVINCFGTDIAVYKYRAERVKWQKKFGKVHVRWMKK